MSTYRVFVSAAALVIASYVVGVGARTYGDPLAVELVPARSTSSFFSIVGNEIALVQGEGVDVELDIFLSGWGGSDGTTLLGAYEFRVDGFGMLGINAEPSRPGVDLRFPPEPFAECVSDSDCATGLCGSADQGFCDDTLRAFLRPRVCELIPSQMCSDSAQCPSECIGNPELAGFGCGGFPHQSLSPSNGSLQMFNICRCCSGGPNCGGPCLCDNVPADQGFPQYIGTVRVIVPPNAAGTYTINFVLGSDLTFVLDECAVHIPIPTVSPAVITVGVACCSGGNCLVQLPEECAAVNGFVVPLCLGDGDGNGVDDICEAGCDEMGPGVPDCNNNDQPDRCDIAACQGSDPFCADCNFNGIPDECDIDSGTSTDCNNNDLPDECEIPVGSDAPGGPYFCTFDCEPDCNNNGVPDTCDVTQGTSTDCNNNDLLDRCEIAVGSNAQGGPFFCTDFCEPDCNNNGLPDACDIDQLTSLDCVRNGIPDECEMADGTIPDCNDNGIHDDCEEWACCLDADGDSFFETCSLSGSADCRQLGEVFRGPCNVCPEQSVAIIRELGGEVFVHVIAAPIDCVGETGDGAAARGGCVPGDPKIDPWRSISDPQMCHNFGAPGHTIPADFFGPGSDPFGDSVCLAGDPLGVTPFGDFGEADTLISRTDDPFDRCSMPSASQSAVDLEVVALSLVDDSDPATVTFNGGQNPEQWTVAVDLSEITPPVGSLTATKTHCNGGTYTSVLNVQPRFTFTKVGDPGQVRVLDTGLEGISHISLVQNEAAPWVHDVDPNLGLASDPCSTFRPGVEDALQTVDCDCDGNTLRDKCDIEELASSDCNLNGVPDSCDVLATTSPDCNENNVPDECELIAPAIPLAPDDIQKNRFVAFAPANPACVAFRVELLDLACSSAGQKCSGDADCKICDAGAEEGEGCAIDADCPGGSCVISGETCDEQSLPVQLGWVDDPFVPDSELIPAETFGAIVVQAMPPPRMWPEAVVHVGDCEVAPFRIYAISATGDGISFSPRLVLGTTRSPQGKFWADLVGSFDGFDWSPPNGLLGVDDVSAMIKFITLKPAPHITVVDLSGQVPNWLINATDLQIVIGAFKGDPYPPVAFPNKGSPADCP